MVVNAGILGWILDQCFFYFSGKFLLYFIYIFGVNTNIFLLDVRDTN